MCAIIAIKNNLLYKIFWGYNYNSGDAQNMKFQKRAQKQKSSFHNGDT